MPLGSGKIGELKHHTPSQSWDNGRTIFSVEGGKRNSTNWHKKARRKLVFVRDSKEEKTLVYEK